MKLLLNEIKIDNSQHRRSLLPSFITQRINNYNGKKIGKKQPISTEQIKVYRELDKAIKLPPNVSLKVKGNHNYEISGDEIWTPKRGGNAIRYFNTDKYGRPARVADKGVIWLLCGLKCKANIKDDYSFGIYGQDETPTIDHCISQSTLNRWYLKGIIEKSAMQYNGNFLLMRLSKNTSKSDRSEYLRVSKYFTTAEVKQAKALLDTWIISSDIKNLYQIGKERKKDQVVTAAPYQKLCLWYKTHQILNTSFYQETIGSLNPDQYPQKMVERFHKNEAKAVGSKEQILKKLKEQNSKKLKGE